MFKKALIAVFAIALLVPTTASAWTPNNNYAFTGTLTSTLQVAGLPSLTCATVTFQTTLKAPIQNVENPGEVTAGTATTCTTTVPNCIVTITLGAFPWQVTGANTSAGSGPVIVAGVQFNATYANNGANVCQLGGPQTFTVDGAAVGGYVDTTGILTFPAAPELTNLWVTDTTGAPADQTRVLLTGPMSESGATTPALT